MRVLLAYDSLSGNTKMVADRIHELLEKAGCNVTFFRVAPDVTYPLSESYDLYILGAWTVDYGRTAPDMKDFIAELDMKPEHIALFGTGETQWGEENFCGAVDRMAKYFDSSYPTLKIEQMPHTAEDEAMIQTFVKQVMAKRSESK